jgi:regulator of sigma E protease
VGVPVSGTWVGGVLPSSPALSAGLQKDDHIIGIDGTSVRRWTEMVKIIQVNAGKKLLLQVERKGKTLEIPITPSSKSLDGKELGFGRIGISLSLRTFTDRHGPLDAVWKSFDQTYAIIHLTVTTIYGMIVQTVPADIGGPIRISRVAAEQAKRGLRYVALFTILLSLNLAILNLLPIPILDGGHLLFLTIEALRGKPISLRIREMSMQVGMVLLIGLMVFATYKDSVYYFLQWTR